MKRYRVRINDSLYEIELEEIKPGDDVTVKADSKPVSKPAAPSNNTGAMEIVTSPMPGNILSVNVTEGQTVNKGDVLMVLEAMKMENEIMAPVSGTVSSVIAKGSAVETGAVLCRIK